MKRYELVKKVTAIQTTDTSNLIATDDCNIKIFGTKRKRKKILITIMKNILLLKNLIS